jgi:small subunit ribosomal protein S1
MVDDSNRRQNWYEKWLTDHDYASPRRGQVLEGEILRIDDDGLVVGVGLKRDAIVPSRDLSQLEDSYVESLSVGDRIIVSVIKTATGDRDLLVSLKQGLEHQDWNLAETYLKNGTISKLEVVGHNKGGMLVMFESLRGFVPASQIPELRRARDRQSAQLIKQNMVGSFLEVKTIEVDRQRSRLVFSVHAAQEERRQQRLSELENGQIVLQARVVSVVDFGVFVDLDGIDGLVHISELDWERVRRPSDLFKPGDEIDVQVIKVDIENERVALSRKALLPNPWESLKEKYRPGDVISGRVTRVLDFGAFVELPEGVVGLVHSSEIGYTTTGRPQEVVKEGDSVLVRIIEIDTVKGRVSLSMRRVPRDVQIAWIAEHLDEAGVEAGVGEDVEDEVAIDTDTETGGMGDPVDELTSDAGPETEIGEEQEGIVEKTDTEPEKGDRLDDGMDDTDVEPDLNPGEELDGEEVSDADRDPGGDGAYESEHSSTE